MITPEQFDKFRYIQPYFFYNRVTLLSPLTYLFFTLDYGFWYILKQIHVKYASSDKVNFFPEINVFAVQKAASKEPQNTPIPFNLFCTPGNSGIELFPGNEMTAGNPSSAKLQNVSYPFRDTMEFQITGQNLIGPPVLDFCLIGYYLPVSSFSMWNK